MALRRRRTAPGYVDVDLLISPADARRRDNLLADAGFELSLREVALPDGRRPHAGTWVRAADGVNVDLHDTLPGLSVAPEAVWAELEQTTETLVVGRPKSQFSPSPPAHSSHAACGPSRRRGSTAARGSRPRSRPRPRVDLAGCGAVADRLDAVPAFAVGLRLLPEGAASQTPSSFRREHDRAAPARELRPSSRSASTGSCRRRRFARAPGWSGGGSRLPPGS